MLIIHAFEQFDFFTFWIRGKKRLFHLIRIIFDDAVGSFDDHFGRSVILLEIDDFCFGVVFFKRKDILDIGSSPAIDTLPVITDDTEIFRFGGKYTDGFILQCIGILVFIDHKIFESTLKILNYFRKFEYLSKE